MLQLPSQLVIVSVDGLVGQPGNQLYDHRDKVGQSSLLSYPPGPFSRLTLPLALPSRTGEHGRSAYPATAGTPGGTISLELTSSKLELHGIHAEGTGEWAGKRWEVAADKTLFLSARGGDGGDGGRGEDGQNGGYGVNGQDSTQEYDATVTA